MILTMAMTTCTACGVWVVRCWEMTTVGRRKRLPTGRLQLVYSLVSTCAAVMAIIWKTCSAIFSTLLQTYRCPPLEAGNQRPSVHHQRRALPSMTSNSCAFAWLNMHSISVVRTSIYVYWTLLNWLFFVCRRFSLLLITQLDTSTRWFLFFLNEFAAAAVATLLSFHHSHLSTSTQSLYYCKLIFHTRLINSGKDRCTTSNKLIPVLCRHSRQLWYDYILIFLI